MARADEVLEKMGLFHPYLKTQIRLYGTATGPSIFHFFNVENISEIQKEKKIGRIFKKMLD